MSFDAGAVEGRLELNNEGFTGSMLEAEGIARIFPEVVTDFLADPLLGFAETAKEVGEKVIDTFQEIQEDAEDVGLASMKLGVSPEFFSTWAAIGKTVQVGTEQMTAGFRFLELHSQEALEGSKSAKKGFTELGISMQELAVHQGDVEWMWQRVRKALEAIEDPGKRALAATELMGRGGAALLPVLEMTSEHVDELRRKFVGFGDEVDSGEAATAQKFQDLETVAGWAAEGIGKAFEKPVFDWFGDHADEIMGKVGAAANWLIGDVNKLWASFKSESTQAEIHHLEDVAVQGFGKVEDSAKKVWAELNSSEAKAAIANIEGFGKQLIEDLPKVTKIATDAAKVLTDMLKAGQDEIHGKMPKDDFTSNIGKSLAQIIVPAGLDTTGPRQMGLTPEAQQRIKDYIHKELGIDVPQGTTDQEHHLSDRAIQHAQGVDRKFPGSHTQSAQDAATDDQLTILDKARHGEATSADTQRMRDDAQRAAAPPPQINVTVHAIFPNLNPFDIGKKVIDGINAEVKKVAGRANVQSVAGG